MVAADDDRRRDIARGDEIVEPETGQVALAVGEPADPGGQTLEMDPLLMPSASSDGASRCRGIARRWPGR